jgi:undecaprenyl-diphosphatase
MRVHARRILQRVAQIRENRAITTLAVLSAVFLLLSLIAHSPGLLHVDREITQEIQSGRSRRLDQVAQGFTFLGNTITLIVIGSLGAALLLAARRPWAALLCAVTLLGVPLNMLLKEWVGRPRPEEGIVAVLLPTVGLSFPSGHAMASVMLYGFLSLMAWIHVRNRTPRLIGTALFAALAFCISVSRIYLGAHWFSDVVGGWTAGLFFLLLLLELYKLVGTRELGRDA